eukprot:jgi/Mesvir1/15683/Mv03274-RA.2
MHSLHGSVTAFASAHARSPACALPRQGYQHVAVDAFAPSASEQLPRTLLSSAGSRALPGRSRDDSGCSLSDTLPARPCHRRAPPGTIADIGTSLRNTATQAGPVARSHRPWLQQSNGLHQAPNIPQSWSKNTRTFHAAALQCHRARSNTWLSQSSGHLPTARGSYIWKLCVFGRRFSSSIRPRASSTDARTEEGGMAGGNSQKGAEVPDGSSQRDPIRRPALLDNETLLRETKELVECAMLAAASGLLFFLSSLIRIESYMGMLFPLPTVIAGARWGPRAALRTMVTSALLLFLLAGPVKAALYLLLHGLIAVVLGALWSKGVPWPLSVALCTAVRFVGILGTLNVMSWLLQENILALILVNSVSYIFLLHVLYAIILNNLGLRAVHLPRWINRHLGYA